MSALSCRAKPAASGRGRQALDAIGPRGRFVRLGAVTRLKRILTAARLRRVAAILASSAIIALAAGPAAASVAAPTGVEDFSFDSYDADYYLSRDAGNHATLKTVETFVAKFPSFDQNRGIIRMIPDDYNGVPLHTTVVSVTDAAGKAVHYASTDDGSSTQLALGTNDYVRGRQTYRITYTQQNVVRHFANTNDDELYWDTNGTGFSQPFGSVTARVHVDPSIASLLTGNQTCYRGAEGSTTKCDILRSPEATSPATPASQEAVFTAKTTSLGGNQTMTVAIGFASGSFVQVPADSSPGGGSSLSPPVPLWSTVIAIILVIAGGAIAVGSLVRRVFFGQRDAAGRGIIVPQYTVPKGIDLLEAASITKRMSTGLSAQLVSFAVRGNLRILDYKIEPDDGDFTLQYLGDAGVDASEQRLLVALFGAELTPGALRQLGVVDDAFARELAAIQGSVGEGIVSRGLRMKPSRKDGVTATKAVLAILAVDVVFAIVSSLLGAFSQVMIGAFFLVPVGFIAAASLLGRPPVLTDAGAEQRDYLLGMRDYLQLAEADRFRVLQSPEGADRVSVGAATGTAGTVAVDVGDKAEMVKLYEKLLPFAVLWGVEKEWSKELAVYYDAGVGSPDWYASNGAFNSLLFTAALVNLQSSVATTSTPAASSGGGSFGGGSFGGGFSGGGGGGGGGGR